VNALGRRIVRGEFEADRVLDLPLLEEELESGRSALREALKVLSAKGLLDARQGTGTFVTQRIAWNLLDPDVLRWHHEVQPTEPFLRSLSEFRLAVEPAAAAFAAQRRSDEDLARLDTALAGMTRAADLLVFTDADLRFHRTVLEASGNEFFGQLESLIEAGLSTRNATLATWDARRAASLSEHGIVVDAIRSRQPDLAAAAMRALLTASREDELVRSNGEPRPTTG
jgi:DNA-binding FadR family transcriptional regulator